MLIRQETLTKKNTDNVHQPIVLIASAIIKVRKRWSHALHDVYYIQEVSDWNKLEWSMANQRPSVLLLNQALLQVDGNRIERISDLKRLSPSTKIILLTSMCDEKEAASGLKLGVKGYCHKDIDPPLLKKAIEVVLEGEVWVGRKTISHLLSELASHTESQQEVPNLSDICLDYLTLREYQIARLVGDGANNKEIARRLKISEKTVKAHLTAIFQKLQIPDRLHLGLFVAGHKTASIKSNKKVHRKQ